MTIKGRLSDTIKTKIMNEPRETFYRISINSDFQRFFYMKRKRVLYRNSRRRSLTRIIIIIEKNLIKKKKMMKHLFEYFKFLNDKDLDFLHTQ